MPHESMMPSPNSVRAACALAAAWLIGLTPAAAATDFDSWSAQLAADWMRQAPEYSSAIRYFEGAEQDRLDRQLSSVATRRVARRQLAQKGLVELETFAADRLSPSQQNASATLRWSLQRTLAAEPFEDHGFAFNQLQGLQVAMVNLFTRSHPLRRPQDIESYLARLDQVAARFDETIASSRKAAERGLIPPRFIVERARDQIEAFVKPTPADNLLVSALDQRSRQIAGLSVAERQRAVAQAESLVTDAVRPAFQRALAWLDELHPRTTNDAGLWRLPDGAAAYEQALASNTTTSMGAEQVHTLGLREVARIEAEMEAQLKKLGRVDGSVSARIRTLNLELQPPAQPDPRPGLILRYAEHVQDAQRRAQPLFGITPMAAVEVQRVPALTERTASAHYTTPVADGSRPGIFWVPLPGPTFNMLGMRSLAVHEAVPGHHFQLALQQEEKALPHWRQHRVFGGGSAHSEGWALYAEYLAIEQGWYEDDAHSLLGALGAQLFRARRLVVDTGLHARRWTRQQAIDYDISVSEVERYVANPGQATAYMIGMLHILALREQAKASMGERFVLSAFHDTVLRAGSVPLEVLSSVVQAWAAGAAPASPDRSQRTP